MDFAKQNRDFFIGHTIRILVMDLKINIDFLRKVASLLYRFSTKFIGVNCTLMAVCNKSIKDCLLHDKQSGVLLLDTLKPN